VVCAPPFFFLGYVHAHYILMQLWTLQIWTLFLGTTC
jgi:hypothetical protein